MFIDTHCHLQYNPIISGLESVLNECKNRDVRTIVCVGTDIQASKEALKIAGYKNDILILASCGIHPTEVNSYQDFPHQEFEEIITSKNASLSQSYQTTIHFNYTFNKDDLCLIPFIGECGLDYFHKNTSKEQQINFLEKQITIAKKHNKILILHIRDAFEDIKNIVKKFFPFKFISHCFSGTYEDAKFFIDNGGYISFALNITYPKNENLTKVLEKLPQDRILFETDAPFLPPQRLRGKHNYPYYVIEGYKLASTLLGIDLHVLTERIYENFHTLLFY